MPAEVRAAFCGFTDPDQPGCETLQNIPTDQDGQVSVKACTGGWGILLMLVNHQVHLCKQTLLKFQDTVVTSHQVQHKSGIVANQSATLHSACLMQGISPLSAGSFQTGAVGWQQMLTITKEGQLYASPLPHAQAPVNPDRAQQNHNADAPNWQLMTHFKLHVLEVAAGEQHRCRTILCQQLCGCNHGGAIILMPAGW